MQLFITERNPLSRSVQDQAAVRAFLAATGDLSPEEAGELVGLSGVRVRQYRAGEWKRLNSATRRTLEVFVESAPARESPTYAAALTHAAEKMQAVVDELRSQATVAAAKEAKDADHNRRLVEDAERASLDLPPQNTAEG